MDCSVILVLHTSPLTHPTPIQEWYERTVAHLTAFEKRQAKEIEQATKQVRDEAFVESSFLSFCHVEVLEV